MDSLTISIRGGFSDRYGIKSENTDIQIDDFDTRTRTKMANYMNSIIYCCYEDQLLSEEVQIFIRNIRMNVYLLDVDYSHHYSLSDTIHILTETIHNNSYDSVLSVIEYVCRTIAEYRKSEKPYILYNDLFEKEYVGYRFVDGLITPITDMNVVGSIEKAIVSTDQQVNEHFKKALALISNREKPDYENSIKESISAVEAECNLINGRAGTLKEILNELEKNKKVNIHPALREAFIKLYGYTGDGKGIRHAGQIGGENASFAEAEFMLISCSAFVNYLRCNIAD